MEMRCEGGGETIPPTIHRQMSHPIGAPNTIYLAARPSFQRQVKKGCYTYNVVWLLQMHCTHRTHTHTHTHSPAVKCLVPFP